MRTVGSVYAYTRATRESDPDRAVRRHCQAIWNPRFGGDKDFSVAQRSITADRVTKDALAS